MSTPLTVSRLSTNDLEAAPSTTTLLTDAHLCHPHGRLLGSIVAAEGPAAESLHKTVVLVSKRRGRVDVVHDNGRLVGVACWITHPAHHRSRPGVPTPLSEPALRVSPTNLHHQLDRLEMLDLAFAVPDDTTHQHLACLGTRPGYGARTIADLLLHHQHQRADRRRHTLYIEAHHRTDRAWLHRLGYRDHGISRHEPHSHALARAPQRRRAAH